MLSTAIPFTVSLRSCRTCRTPRCLPYSEGGREGSGHGEHQARWAEGTSSVASGPGWKGSVAQCIAGGLISISDSLFNQFRFEVNFPLSPLSDV